MTAEPGPDDDAIARRRLPSWVTFTVLRLMCFAVPLAICLALNLDVLLATPIALVVAAILSNLLLRRWRTALALDLDRIRRGERTRPGTPQDEDAEDAALDGPDAAGSTQSTSAAASPKP